ncbi:hypothetical protein HDZ31DRAFT_64933 [Schizophyllum fasciatum]
MLDQNPDHDAGVSQITCHNGDYLFGNARQDEPCAQQLLSDAVKDTTEAREARRLAKGKFRALEDPHSWVGASDTREHALSSHTSVTEDLSLLCTQPVPSATCGATPWQAAKAPVESPDEESLLPEVAVKAEDDSEVPDSEADETDSSASEDEVDELDNDDASDAGSQVPDSEAETDLHFRARSPSREEGGSATREWMEEDAVASHLFEGTESDAYEPPVTPPSSPIRGRYGKVTMQFLQESAQRRVERRRQLEAETRATQDGPGHAYTLFAFDLSRESDVQASPPRGGNTTPSPASSVMASRNCSPVPFERSRAPSPVESHPGAMQSSEATGHLPQPRRTAPGSPSPIRIGVQAAELPIARSSVPLPRRKDCRTALEASETASPDTSVGVELEARALPPPLPSRQRPHDIQQTATSNVVEGKVHPDEASLMAPATVSMKRSVEALLTTADMPATKKAKVVMAPDPAAPGVKVEGAKTEKGKAKRVKTERSKKEKAETVRRNRTVSRPSRKATTDSSLSCSQALPPSPSITRGPLPLARVIDWITRLERAIYLLEARTPPADLPAQLAAALAAVAAHARHPDFTVHTGHAQMAARAIQVVGLLEKLRRAGFWAAVVRHPEAWRAQRDLASQVWRALRRQWFPRKRAQDGEGKEGRT